MKRIAVIGTSCSGKTHFSKRLAACLDIPHVELDALYWGPDCFLEGITADAYTLYHPGKAVCGQSGVVLQCISCSRFVSPVGISELLAAPKRISGFISIAGVVSSVRHSTQEHE